MSVWYGGKRRTPEGIEKERKRKRLLARRQVRMRAGGIQFSLGYAPTAEAAQHLRRKIREEAPRG